MVSKKFKDRYLRAAIIAALALAGLFMLYVNGGPNVYYSGVQVEK